MSPIEQDHRLPSIHDKPVPPADSNALEHDLSYTFKISRVSQPKEVRNLWQLMVKTPTDARAMEVVDADTLSTVIGKIQYVFEADGL